jgi:hypothetical protein
MTRCCGFDAAHVVIAMRRTCLLCCGARGYDVGVFRSDARSMIDTFPRIPTTFESMLLQAGCRRGNGVGVGHLVRDLGVSDLISHLVSDIFGGPNLLNVNVNPFYFDAVGYFQWPWRSFGLAVLLYF